MGATEYINQYFEQYHDFLNHYHHVLQCHLNDTDPNTYQLMAIFTTLRKFIKCQVPNCQNYVRSQTKQHSKSDIPIDEPLKYIMDLLDNVHVHFLHSYDMGYRLKDEILNEINNDQNEQDELNDVECIDQTMQRFKKYISENRIKNNITATLRPLRLCHYLSDFRSSQNEFSMASYYELGEHYYYGPETIQNET